MVFEFACRQDINSWMELLELVKANFRGLEKEEYKKNLQISITKKETLIAKKDNQVVGALAFSTSSREIIFLAVYPEYRAISFSQYHYHSYKAC